MLRQCDGERDHILKTVTPKLACKGTVCISRVLESMLAQHHPIGLQTYCMLILLVEAARFRGVWPMAIGYGLPPLSLNALSR